MPVRHPIAFVAAVLGLAACASAAGTAQRAAHDVYRGRDCPPPRGHKVTDCRLAARGSPDLSRNAFRALFGQEVTISHRVRTLAPNPAQGGARRWPLIDSLAMPMGTVEQDADGAGLILVDLAGKTYRVGVANVRGRGCAADLRQQRTFMLLQLIARTARASGTQAFVDQRALDRSSEQGESAYQGLVKQRGGGTKCGPPGHRKPIGRRRGLRNPAVGEVAHARLGSGVLNSVTEYDAKPEFGNAVYFSSNTTSVHAGGIARGMVRVGTPVARIDAFGYCDPNSDGTLIWRKYAIYTGARSGRRLYGWIPGRCPPRLKGVQPPR